ncbi:MarR family transcriptional regulator [Micromonospora polyrhachis]|uniref:DNA-binding transcriptional regulator GbsR (MarR family) n=1 Tax=Micromonospora polyrhachis TaxID=1282883 RepID=A0A7W7SM99_9ACTN|nr:MarR family transcriptional regulator [Micromonospora polyrhachis]MBB4957354.1 DNA-binding transcriptional regulator GbsR (MarR family) [Micromonospora polyrhachis]
MPALSDPAERLALSLAQGGMQRMTARVLAALLFTEQETLTAGEITELLTSSSGSVSMALKSLTSVGLVERVPAPGSRREHFRVRSDAWATLMSDQNQMVRVMREAAEEGIAATGENSTAGRRLAEMRDFYDYLWRELPALIDAWRTRRPAP